MTEKKTTTNVAKIDELIAEAKARVGKRAKGEKVEKPPKAPDPEKEAARLKKQQEREAATAERDRVRAQKQAQREAETAARQQARDAAKAEKQRERQEKLAARKPAHLAKLEKAQGKLPALGDGAAQAMAFVTTAGLSAGDLAALAEHVAFEARRAQTVAALTAKLQAGDAVRIVTGKHAGEVGTLERVQRIRCFVKLPGQAKPVYLFTSEVEPVTPATVEADAAAEEPAVSVAA